MKKYIAVGMIALLGMLAGPLVSRAQGTFQLSQPEFHFYYSIGGAVPTLQPGTYTNVTGNTITYSISIPNQPKWFNCSYVTTPLTLAPNTPSGICAAVNPAGLAAGTYATTIYLSGNFPDSPVAIPVSLTVQPAGVPLPSGQVHPEGTNVVGPNGTVYLISGGARYPYTSEGAFLSYSFNTWAGVVAANAADLALPIPTTSRRDGTGPITAFIQPRDGSLIDDNGTVYIISDGYRQGFTSADVFLGLGYSFSNVLKGDASFMLPLTPLNSSDMSHPPGTVVNEDGKICIMFSQFKGGGRKCFSNLADMNSWGIVPSTIVTANAHDRLVLMTGVMYPRTSFSILNP